MHLKFRSAFSALAGTGLALLAAASPTLADGPKVGYTSFGLTHTYTVVLAQLTEKYGKELGLDMLPTVDSQFDAAKQVTDISTMIASGVQGIILNTVDSSAIKVALDRAEAAGVKVVAVDTGPDSGHVAMMVRVSSVTLGREACQDLGKRMNGTGTALEIQGSFATQVGVLRSQGFNDCMAANFPGIKVISKQADWVQDQATTIAQTVLSTDPSVTGIFLAGDSVYLPGVLNVLKRVDRLAKVDEEGHVVIVGIDGDPFALEQIRAGYMDSTVSQPLISYAEWGVRYLKAAIEGETFAVGKTDHNSEIVQDGDNLADVLEPTIVDKNNVDDAGLWGNVKAQ